MTLDELQAALAERGYTRIDVGIDLSRWTACLSRGDDAAAWGPPRDSLREAVEAVLACAEVPS